MTKNEYTALCAKFAKTILEVGRKIFGKDFGFSLVIPVASIKESEEFIKANPECILATLHCGYEIELGRKILATAANKEAKSEADCQCEKCQKMRAIVANFPPPPVDILSN